MTVLKSEHISSASPGTAADAPPPPGPGRILFVQYTNPGAYPPLQHSSRLLARQGWDVRFMGTGARGAGALRFPPHPRIRVDQIPFCPPGFKQKVQYARYWLWVLGAVAAWRPRWIYASELMACPIALSASLLFGVPVVYHEHDAPTNGGASLFNRLCMRARRALSRHARLCVIPNRRRAEAFASTEAPRALEVVWNCPSREEADFPPREPLAGTLTLLYHGSIVPERLPRAVVEALARLPEGVRLSVVGYETNSSIGYSESLRRRAAELGIEGRLTFHGAVPLRGDLMRICRTADVGLALLPSESNDHNLEMMIGASNKPFDYLACGLPLVVSDLPEWRALYVDGGYARPCEATDPESIANAVRWYWDRPAGLREMGERGRQRVLAEWNYEAVFAPVADLLNSR